MKKYETVTVTEKSLKNVSCDICGEVSSDGGWWESDDFQDSKSTIILKEGSILADEFSIVAEIDLCPSCFKNQLLPSIPILKAKVLKELAEKKEIERIKAELERLEREKEDAEEIQL